VGDEIATGQTVALLEVMKTFNRLAYGGDGLPERARVKAVLVRDEADVEAGAPILELEPL
jgi:acetyl-CoA carboxylase biotin carboxyl carrier protein